MSKSNLELENEKIFLILGFLLRYGKVSHYFNNLGGPPQNFNEYISGFNLSRDRESKPSIDAIHELLLRLPNIGEKTASKILSGDPTTRSLGKAVRYIAEDLHLLPDDLRKVCQNRAVLEEQIRTEYPEAYEEYRQLRNPHALALERSGQVTAGRGTQDQAHSEPLSRDADGTRNIDPLPWARWISDEMLVSEKPKGPDDKHRFR